MSAYRSDCKKQQGLYNSASLEKYRVSRRFIYKESKSTYRHRYNPRYSIQIELLGRYARYYIHQTFNYSNYSQLLVYTRISSERKFILISNYIYIFL